MLSYRSTRHLSNFKSPENKSVFLATFLLCLGLHDLAQAEAVIILDPYFYRTPLSESIDGSTKTVLGYYEETEGRVTPLPKATSEPLPELRTLAIAYAQAILKRIEPKVIRDKHGVIVAIRFEDQDPALSSIVLTPGFSNRFANSLGKNCLVAIPNRQTVFVFPRLGSNFEEFSIPLRSFYHNSVWPVSTELFEWKDGALHRNRDLEAN